MKQIFYIFTFFISMSCGQSSSEQKNALKTSADTDTVKTGQNKEETELNDQIKSTQQIDYHKKLLDYEFDKAILFQLTDTLTADFNGDGNPDQAIFIKENETSGLIIKHGKSNEQVKIGFGKSFATWKNFDFNWVDFWGLVNDSETYEVVIEDAEIVGGRNVKLENPSIVVRREEAGGGLITFKNGKYEWIHQSD